ncbi:hypothetical protein QZH46_07165 [Pseudomonas corrugata]
MAGLSGGVTALAGVIPGIGTVTAMVGGALADVTISTKLQVDMCMCLVIEINKDISDEDAKAMSLLISVSGVLEQWGAPFLKDLFSKQGVKLLQRYLRGDVLKLIKELFQALGITFTRKAAEKAIPFGVGVLIGSTVGYTLTKAVGHLAVGLLKADAEAAPDETDPEGIDKGEIIDGDLPSV